MNRFLFTLPLAAAGLFITATSVIALDEKPKARNAGRAPGERLKVMTEKLGLTEEQQGKIKAILEATAPKAKELRADTALSKEDKRAKMMELRKGEIAEIRAVLTPEQQEKMKEMRAARRGAKSAK